MLNWYCPGCGVRGLHEHVANGVVGCFNCDDLWRIFDVRAEMGKLSSAVSLFDQLMSEQGDKVHEEYMRFWKGGA